MLLDQSCVGLTRVLCCSEESSMNSLVSMNSWSRANCKERLDLVGVHACTIFFSPNIFNIRMWSMAEASLQAKIQILTPTQRP